MNYVTFPDWGDFQLKGEIPHRNGFTMFLKLSVLLVVLLSLKQSQSGIMKILKLFVSQQTSITFMFSQKLQLNTQWKMKASKTMS